MLGFQTYGKVRWWLVNRLQLNQRPSWCWNAVLCWIVFRTWRELPSSVQNLEYDTTGCKMSAQRNGVCYCGKFATADFAAEAQLMNPLIVTSVEEPEVVA